MCLCVLGGGSGCTKGRVNEDRKHERKQEKGET